MISLAKQFQKTIEESAVIHFQGDARPWQEPENLNAVNGVKWLKEVPRRIQTGPPQEMFDRALGVTKG